MIRKDNLKLGILLGFLAPLLGMILYYFAVFYTKGISFRGYLYYLDGNKSLLTGVSSISLVMNAIIFTLFVNARKDKSARGIFIATLIYGIGVLTVKFLI
jgi:hypothetical protein